MIRVVLASQSPARRQILTSSGIDPIIIVSEVDERALEASFTGSVGDLTTALSEAKARAVIERITTADAPQISDADTVVVIAGDSILEAAGRAIGKPSTAERTREIWADIAGTWTVLHTGHTLGVLSRRDTAGPDAEESPLELVDIRSQRSATSVLIGTPTPEELDAYIATEEPFHVAGALTIDGYGGAFVERLDGDHLTVLGLSLPVVRGLAGDMGLFWPDFWSGPS
ncbi:MULTISPECIES: Maf family protein [unclassified Brevibacterium]|uniref:Maf family protein n=1 Tax=unclassified Brevibacterium TaxID=2614124 RepID=UPI001E382F20|nr:MULTISPECIES: Maf family protein [unclassified Brevibacterium]MCD1284470.1 maf protein [Brevibacterium sp. CCUG 69071]MDK8435914.1 Maf family protein [Brevibacterium sp. H-BE7]